MSATVAPQEPQAFPHAVEAHRARFRSLVERALPARPVLTLSQWADANRVLSRESSAEPGPWRTERIPYLREILDAVSDPTIEEVAVVKGAQVGYTQGLILNAIGYWIHQDPGPILAVLPSDGEAEKFSKEKLAPMIRDVPAVGSRVSEAKGRDANNTILSKTFVNGFLGITGATSPKGLRSRSSRYVLFDEVDAYPASAGAEGDPITLAKKRALSFFNRKYVLGSTPTVKGASRIEAAWLASDQRRYWMPCPTCGVAQVLVWGGRDVAHGLKWEADDPTTAYYRCLTGCRIDESAKPWMLARGEWRPGNPGARVRGYHIPGLISPFEGASWSVLVTEWLEAQQQPERLRAFVNTVLGETWEDQGEAVSPDALLERLEAFPVDAEGELLVPGRVLALTRSVDVQGDRLETAVWGWGLGEECWLVDHDVLPGDPGTPRPWADLDAQIGRAFRTDDGRALVPLVTLVDSGGHHTDSVYRYCGARLRQRVFACKGQGGEGTPLVGRPTRSNNARVALYPIGSFVGREALAARLAKVRAPGPSYIHLPSWLDAEQLRQLTAEALVTKMIGGRPTRVWIKRYERNELTDLWIYGLAALRCLGVFQLRRLGLSGRGAVPTPAEASGTPHDAAPTPTPADMTPPSSPDVPTPTLPAPPPTRAVTATRPPRPSGGGWVGGWRR